MVQSPSREANWFAARQEIPRISRNPKVHYRTHKHPPPLLHDASLGNTPPPPPPAIPSGGVVYFRIVLSPEQASYL